MTRSISILMLLLLTAGCRDERSPDDPEAAAEALGAPAITAGSGSKKDNHEDGSDGRAYVASMKDMEAFAEATRNLKQLARRHPELQSKAVFNLSEIDRMAGNLDSDPRLIEAVEDAGLTTRKYAMLSSLTVLMGLASLASDEEARKMTADAQVHPDNLVFFRENAARIRELNEAAQR